MNDKQLNGPSILDDVFRTDPPPPTYVKDAAGIRLDKGKPRPEIPESAAGEVRGLRLDGGKPRWNLLPMDALGEVVKVFTFGAAKYSDNNWRLPGIKWGQHYSAAMRHLAAFQSGEEVEGESKLYHLAHAICDLLMLLASYLNGYGEDDRPGKDVKK